MTQAQPIIVTGTISTGEVPVWAPSSASKKIFASLSHDALADEQFLYFSSSVPVDLLQQAFHENLTLRSKVASLEAQMADLRYHLGLDRPEPRTLTKPQARREIAGYFEAHPDQKIYPSDVAADLNLDYDLVLDTIEQLEDEGQVAKAEA